MTVTNPPASTSGIPIWLTTGPEPVYAVIHEGAGAEHRDTAVLMLPSFGWDEACSYRARRNWAVALANAGFTTVRFDLPGTEDSAGGPLAPGRLDAWLAATRDLSRWLLTTSDATRVAAIGIGLGGLVATAATAAGAPIDDLILWATPRRGSTYVRELKIAARVMSTEGPEPHDELENAFEFGGYVMSNDTIAALSDLDLTAVKLPATGDRHILMLGRGSNPVDRRLQEHLEGHASVTTLPGDEYEQMMASPDYSVAPTVAIERSIAWLSERSGLVRSSNSLLDSDLVTTSVVIEVAGESVTERHVECMTPVGRLYGILAEPIDAPSPAPVCVVSVNTGALRRVSPARLWTDLCRKSAARGIPALRLDLEGIGDSDGVFLHNHERTAEDDARIVLSQIEFHDLLEREGVANRFVTVGSCLGAYWETQVAQRDKRVSGTALINTLAFQVTPEQIMDRDRRVVLTAARRNSWTRLREARFPNRTTLRNAAVALVQTVRGTADAVAQAQHDAITVALDTMRDSGTEVRFMFARDEPLLVQMQSTGLTEPETLSQWPNVTLETLPSTDHDLRPLRIQHHLHAQIEQLVDELSGASSPASAQLPSQVPAGSFAVA